jgi:hypothetical protein
LKTLPVIVVESKRNRSVRSYYSIIIMALQILLGDAEVFHRRYNDKSNSWYGEGIDAKQIYICCGSKFVKFHAVFPERSHVREYSRTWTAYHAVLYMNEDQCGFGYV